MILAKCCATVFYLELKDAGEMERAERGASQEKYVEEPSAEGRFCTGVQCTVFLTRRQSIRVSAVPVLDDFAAEHTQRFLTGHFDLKVVAGGWPLIDKLIATGVRCPVSYCESAAEISR